MDVLAPMVIGVFTARVGEGTSEPYGNTISAKGEVRRCSTTAADATNRLRSVLPESGPAAPMSRPKNRGQGSLLAVLFQLVHSTRMGTSKEPSCAN